MMPEDNLGVVLLHGDYSSNQILANEKSVHAIDFSGCIGDPRIDIGNYLGRLRRQVELPDYEYARSVFLNTYRDQREFETNLHSIAWFEAITVLKDAFVTLKRLKYNWPKTICTQIDVAHKVLDAS